MKRTTTWAVVGMACLAGSLLATSGASAQTDDVDSLTCVNVTTDRRNADNPDAFTLTPEDEQLMESRGCKVAGGGRIARADALCYPTSTDAGSDDEPGVDLSGQLYLCYDVRCQRDEMNVGNVRTELEITDRFGDGTIFVNERPTTKRLCIPASLGSSSPTPTPRPIGTPTPNGTATPNGPTPTPPGSASRAFVDVVASLLR